MKSNLLSVVDLSRQDDFSKDIEVVKEIDQKTLASLVENFDELESQRSKKETFNWIGLFAKSHGCDAGKVSYAAGLISFFFRAFLDNRLAKNDDPRDIAIDLADSGLIQKDAINKFIDLLSIIKDKTTAIDKIKRLKEYRKKSIPQLSDIDIAIDYRAVFTEEYDFTKNSDSYDPICEGIIPMVIIQIGLEGGDQENFTFQVDRRSLGILSSYLRVAERQLETGEKFLNIE